MMKVFCPECGSTAELTPETFRCSCGGAWEFEERTDFDASLIEREDASLWRYGRLLGVPFDEPPIRLGAGWTPLLTLAWHGRDIQVKPEYFAPTGSFKDRGTAVMINILAGQGVDHVADDSSGNAGASVAAYTGRAGMQADIFVPSYASPAKQAQVGVYGARVRPIPGPRSNAKKAALGAAAEGDVTLSSHAYHPGFLLGQQTVAWEVWEQLDRRVPDWYVVPVGQGVHLLGFWLGFKRLMEAGLTNSLPRIVGVQPAVLAPVAKAWEAGLETVPEAEVKGHSVAEGMAIAKPVRGRRILQALRETDGMCVTVAEEAIVKGQQGFAHRGFYAEPTSAAVVAALPTVFEQAAPDDVIVVPLTGSGLKGSPKMED